MFWLINAIIMNEKKNGKTVKGMSKHVRRVWPSQWVS